MKYTRDTLIKWLKEQKDLLTPFQKDPPGHTIVIGGDWKDIVFPNGYFGYIFCHYEFVIHRVKEQKSTVYLCVDLEREDYKGFTVAVNNTKTKKQIGVKYRGINSLDIEYEDYIDFNEDFENLVKIYDLEKTPPIEEKRKIKI